MKLRLFTQPLVHYDTDVSIKNFSHNYFVFVICLFNKMQETFAELMTGLDRHSTDLF
jgi:hypothetical protein